jgi:predicted PurR-regulated permease PerM
MSGLLGVAGMFIGVPLFALLYMGFDRAVSRKIGGEKAAEQDDGGGGPS